MKVLLIGQRGRNFSHMVYAEKIGYNADGHGTYTYRGGLYYLDQFGRFFTIRNGSRITLMVDASEAAHIHELNEETK